MAKSLTAFKQKFDNQLKCAVCLDQYSNPKTLPCHHPFCLECIRRLPLDKQGDKASTPHSEHTTFKCPTCRVEHPLPEGGADEFPNAFQINNFLELKNDLTEKETHSTSTSSNEHEETSTVRDKASTCPLHNDPLKVYCKTCDRLICRDCTISNEHCKNHSYDLIVDCYPKHHQQIEGELKQLKSKITDINTAITDLTNRRMAVDEQGDRLSMEIHQHAQQLIKIVLMSEVQLIQQVDVITQHKKEFLAKQKEAAGRVHSQLKTCEELIERNLREMSQGKILLEKQAMIEQMKKASEHVDPATFVPIEEADSKFIKSFKNRDDSIGRIESSTCDNVTLAFKGNKKSSISLTVSSHNKSPFPVPVSAISLVTHSLDSSEPAKMTNCDISHDSSHHRGKYKITLPQVKRSSKVYKLAVQIGGFEQPTGCIMYDIAPVKTIDLKHGHHHLAVCDNGDILATEQMDHSITLLNKEGKKADRSIGTERTSLGKFVNPTGLAITNDGFILLTDRHRLQKLTFRNFSGLCVKSVGSNVPGNDPLQFNDPGGIAVHPTTGQIFVADRDNNRVQVLISNLTFSHFIAPQDDQQFLWPRDVALDSEGYLYVADNNCIWKLTTTGEYVTKFNSPGQSPGPTSIAIGNNLVYVSENSNHCVSVFDTRGKFLHRFGKIGSGLVEFNKPRGIAVDKHGNIYISDFWNNRIVVY